MRLLYVHTDKHTPPHSHTSAPLSGRLDGSLGFVVRQTPICPKYRNNNNDKNGLPTDVNSPPLRKNDYEMSPQKETKHEREEKGEVQRRGKTFATVPTTLFSPTSIFSSLSFSSSSSSPRSQRTTFDCISPKTKDFPRVQQCAALFHPLPSFTSDNVKKSRCPRRYGKEKSLGPFLRIGKFGKSNKRESRYHTPKISCDIPSLSSSTFPVSLSLLA